MGTTPAFPTVNVLGFVSYLISTVCLYASPLIRHQYAIRNPVSPEPTVRFNDIAFALHAVVLSAITWSMFFPRIWGFEQGVWGVGRGISGIFVGCVLSIILLAAFVGSKGGYDASGWAWIDIIYAFGYVKLLVTVVKYIPQVWINYQRKSTVGWSIEQILMDLTGGVLSLAQLIIDSSLQADWSGVTGNPMKFGLGNVSIFFDVIFMLQHYVFYRAARRNRKEGLLNGENRGLLANDEEGER